jgi:lauroyl/myristoyl acyltransferase
MKVPESMGRDLYRALVWGPYRHLCQWVPAGRELEMHRALGRLACRFAGNQRAQVRENLARGFPEEQDLDALVEGVFQSHFAEQYLCFSLGRVQLGNWERYLRFDGLSHLEESLARGRGAVLVHPHMGPAQLPLCVLGLLGHEVLQVTGVPDLEGLSASGRRSGARRAALEQQMTVQLLEGAGYLRPALRTLERGGIVFTAMDGTGEEKEIGRRLSRVVLGREMAVPVGAIWMALKSGAALHTVVTRHAPDEQCAHVAEFGPPWEIEEDASLDKALEKGADQVAAELTRLLRDHPADWVFWDSFEPGRLLAGDS